MRFALSFLQISLMGSKQAKVQSSQWERFLLKMVLEKAKQVCHAICWYM